MTDHCERGQARVPQSSRSTSANGAPPATAVFDRFEGVQGLRFFAAFIVLVTHATFFFASRIDQTFPVWQAGAQGVQIFFVISGFVMIMTTRKLPYGMAGAKTFLYSRIIRIAPLYYILNLLKIVQINMVPSLALARPDIWNIVLSLMFIPSRNAFGKIETFYGVGWTLNFEMMFYLLFSIALAVRLNPLRFVGGMLIILATASLFYRPDWPAIAFFAAPIVLNFLWGMVLAWLVLRGIRLPPVVSLALLVGGLLIFFVHPYFYGLLQLQFAAIVAGVIFLEPYIHGKMPCLLLFGGDASYSLYLIHPLVGVLIVLVCRRLEIVAPAAVLLAVIGGALLAATASYLLFEKPVTRFLRRRFQRREAWKATATGQHGG